MPPHRKAAFTAVLVLLLCSVFFAHGIAKLLFWSDALRAAELVFGHNGLAPVLVVLVTAAEVALALLFLKPTWWKRASRMAVLVLILFTLFAFTGKSLELGATYPGWLVALSYAVLLAASLVVAHRMSSGESPDTARGAYSRLLNHGTFLLVIANVFLFGVVLVRVAQPGG